MESPDNHRVSEGRGLMTETASNLITGSTREHYSRLKFEADWEHLSDITDSLR